MKLSNKISLISFSLGIFATLFAFRLMSNNVEVVHNFEPRKYLGTWYEIARLDYKWEKGLDHVTATYTLKEDSTIKVDNKGYHTKKGKWEESIGKAKAVDKVDEGRLKVSFFGPFYSQYNIVALDKDYKYALVIGESSKYTWILSRDKTIPAEIKQQYLNKAKKLGVKTEELVWVDQN